MNILALNELITLRTMKHQEGTNDLSEESVKVKSKSPQSVGQSELNMGIGRPYKKRDLS